MRRQFRRQIQEVADEVIDILDEVIRVTRKATKALVDGDKVAAQEVVDGDDVFDERCVGVEEHVLTIIATQSPVARDLRLIFSLAVIASRLERMADLASNIARAAIRTSDRQGPQTLYDLIQAQGNLVYRVLETTKESLANRDIELAMKLPELDEPIDHLYKQFFRELSRLSEEEEISWASSMVLASRYLERIADNSVDIGERIAYLITGERDLLEDPDTQLDAP